MTDFPDARATHENNNHGIENNKENAQEKSQKHLRPGVFHSAHKADASHHTANQVHRPKELGRRFARVFKVKTSKPD
jgi:hypothetical protein